MLTQPVYGALVPVADVRLPARTFLVRETRRSPPEAAASRPRPRRPARSPVQSAHGGSPRRVDQALRRLLSRPAPSVAVADAMRRAVYHVLAKGTPYRDPGPDYYDRRHARGSRAGDRTARTPGLRVTPELAA
jgi:hypothetical protein